MLTLVIGTNSTFSISEKLRHLGYSTHAIGKWHVGYCRKEALPTERGFDSFYGMWGGEANYYDHSVGQLSRQAGLPVYDFRENQEKVDDQNGIYSAFSFSKRAAKIINNHQGKQNPFFLYLAYQNVHLPLQEPDAKYMKLNSHLSGSRQIKAAMVTAMDDSVKMVIEALKESNQWDNTIIVFTTDNGGSVTAASLNYPYRGSKGNLYEGGTKAVGFVHGSNLEHAAYTGLMHAVDWMPTLLRAAGAEPNEDNFDGVDQWHHLVKNENSSNRDEIVYNIDEVKGSAGIRVGHWKLLIGRQSKFDDVYTDATMAFSPNHWKKKKLATQAPRAGFPTLDDGYMLFNLENDPQEIADISEEFYYKVEELYKRLKTYEKTLVPSIWPGECQQPPEFGLEGAMTYGWCSKDMQCV